jgi:hypothetical protein
VVKPDGTQSDFGCEQCSPSSAEAALESRSGMKLVAELIDESHFHVTIRACPACGQHFITIFTETIDWADGEDPQYWTRLPLTSYESADLIRRGSELTEATLNALGPGRRSLHRDHPKGEEPSSYWSTGIRVGWHD